MIRSKAIWEWPHQHLMFGWESLVWSFELSLDLFSWLDALDSSREEEGLDDDALVVKGDEDVSEKLNYRSAISSFSCALFLSFFQFALGPSKLFNTFLLTGEVVFFRSCLFSSSVIV